MNIIGDIKNPDRLNINGSLENELNMRYGLLNPNTAGVNKRINEAQSKKDSKMLAAALSVKKDSIESFKKMLNKLT